MAPPDRSAPVGLRVPFDGPPGSLATGRIRRTELDGLRGIAILLVLLSHARVPGFSREGGYVGVTLFFVLSGYLITSILVAERAQKGRVDLPAFYARRALRLFPALLALLLVVITSSAVALRVGQPMDIGSAAPAVVAYVGNWYEVSGRPLGILAHTWSLAVEEQFYIVWPLLLVVALALARPSRIGLAVLAASLIVTPWRLALLQAGAVGHAQIGTDAHADALLLGCAIALLGTRLRRPYGWLAIGGLLIAGAAWPDGTVAAIAIGFPVTAVLGWMAVAACPTGLGWAPLAYLGRISYGLYLWHYVFIWSDLPWPVVIGVSVVVAVLSYHILERPFLRLKDRLGGIPASAPASPLPPVGARRRLEARARVFAP